MKINIIISIIILVITVAILTMVLVKFSEESNFIELQVTSENDDGRTFEVPSTGAYGDEYEAWANLQVNPSYSFGVRFTDVSIPKNATIKEAYVKLFSLGIPKHQHINCTIYCDNVGNAVNFSTMGCLKINGREYTKTSQDWNNNDLPYKDWVKTPSITHLIQEVVNRRDWKTDNAIAVLFISKHTPDSAVFDNYGGGHPARLYIEWSEEK